MTVNVNNEANNKVAAQMLLAEAHLGNQPSKQKALLRALLLKLEAKLKKTEGKGKFVPLKPSENSTSSFFAFLQACYALAQAQGYLIQAQTQSIKNITKKESEWDEELKHLKKYEHDTGMKENAAVDFINNQISMLQSQLGQDTNEMNMSTNGMRMTYQLAGMDVQSWGSALVNSANWKV